MFKPLSILFTVLALTACGPASTPDAAANKATNDAIWSTRKVYDMAGQKVEVAVAPDRSYALAFPVNKSQPLTFAQAEAGIAAVTKCTPTSDGLLLMIAQGNKNTVIPFGKMRGVNRLRFDLKC